MTLTEALEQARDCANWLMAKPDSVAARADLRDALDEIERNTK